MYGCPIQRSKKIKLNFDGNGILPAKEVTRALLSLSGVNHVHLHFFSREVDIDFNPSVTPIADIVSVLSARGGYSKLTITLV